MSNKLKYNSVEDLRANYPDFFWKTVRPYIGDALRYLRVTQEGQQWISNLYANVFSMEHRRQLASLVHLDLMVLVATWWAGYKQLEKAC
jgi:hypothetical protein